MKKMISCHLSSNANPPCNTVDYVHGADAELLELKSILDAGHLFDNCDATSAVIEDARCRLQAFSYLRSDPLPISIFAIVSRVINVRRTASNIMIPF
jgi:hypothetical protein